MSSQLYYRFICLVTMHVRVHLMHFFLKMQVDKFYDFPYLEGIRSVWWVANKIELGLINYEELVLIDNFDLAIYTV